MKWLLIIGSLFLFFSFESASAETIAFEGRVFDAKTGQLIQGAQIKIQPSQWEVITMENRATPDVTHSGKTGHFIITTEADKNNHYSLLISAENYVPIYTAISGDERQLNFSLKPYEKGALVETVFRDKQLYIRKGHLFHLADSRNNYMSRSSGVFKDLRKPSPTTSAFLRTLGIKPKSPTNDEALWNIVLTVWAKLGATLEKSEEGSRQTKYLTHNDAGKFVGLPTIERMAQTYEKFGSLPSLNCLYMANYFATLLIRSGVPVDKIAIADVQQTFADTNWSHYSVIIYIDNNWYYFDPTYMRVKPDFLPPYNTLGSKPEQRPGMDYRHPRFIMQPPGAKESPVPLIYADYGSVKDIGLADRVASYNARGGIWAQQGQLDRAIADFSRAIALKPGDILALMRRADTWYDKQAFDKAIGDYSKVIEKHPELAASAYFKRGRAWHHEAEFERAVADYRKAVQISPNMKRVVEPHLKDAQENRPLQ